MRFIDSKWIYNNVDYAILSKIMKEALIDLYKSNVSVPQRLHLHSKEYKAAYLFMPVVSERLNRVLCKYVGVCSNNAARNLSTINGVAALAQADTGIVDFIFDGAGLTAVRTAGISGASIEALAVDDASILSVFGSSTQAKAQIIAACRLRNIKKINIFYRTKENAVNLAKQIKGLIKADINICNNLEELKNSDIIITATNSKKPLFNDIDLKNSVHICAIGSFRQDMQEVGSDIYANFSVFTDNKESCITESKDLAEPIRMGLLNEDSIINIGSILNKETNPIKNRQTIFKSVGNAAFDLYAADYFSKLAK